MGAKVYAASLALIWLALPGCAGLARLAPPGVIKYEDLAGDQPPNPIIKERIAARRQAIKARYPALSATPSRKPESMPAPAREAEAAKLRSAREALAKGVAEDRAAAAAERAEGVTLPGEAAAGERPLDEAQAALVEAVSRDEAAARRERGLPPRKPADNNP